MSAANSSRDRSLSPQRGLLLLVALGLIWGSAYPVIRYGIVEGASPLGFAAARYLVAALAMAGIAASTRIPRPDARSLALSAVLGLPIVGVYGLLLYIGEETTSGSLASIVIGVTPLLTALFALPILPGERFHRLGYAGLVVGLLGVTILVAPPPGITLASSIWGPVEVLGASASFAIGSVMLRARRPEGETLWGVSVQFGVATLLLAILIPVLEPRSSLPLSGGVLASLAYLVIMPSVVGYALYFYLHHNVGPGRANVVAYVNPLAAITIGTLLFAEPFEWWELVGFALIVIGLTLVTQFRPAHPPDQRTEATFVPAAPLADVNPENPSNEEPPPYPRRP
ncbi:MAG: EamA family transporter [Thermoplasmata archaeon]